MLQHATAKPLQLQLLLLLNGPQEVCIHDPHLLGRHQPEGFRIWHLLQGGPLYPLVLAFANVVLSKYNMVPLL